MGTVRTGRAPTITNTGAGDGPRRRFFPSETPGGSSRHSRPISRTRSASSSSSPGSPAASASVPIAVQAIQVRAASGAVGPKPASITFRMPASASATAWVAGCAGGCTSSQANASSMRAVRVVSG